MKVKSIRKAGSADVFNMEVDETHDFAVSGGAIVHNCRYVLMENPIAPPMPEEAKPWVFNPLEQDGGKRRKSDGTYHDYFRR